MIILQSISKSIGSRTIFKNISFNCPSNTKVALIGNNGVGKTTLLNILCGFDQDYSGETIVPKSVRLGYLPQTINTIIQERDLLLGKMAEDCTQQIFDRYEYLEQMFNILNGYRLEEDAREILRGLGFKDEQFDQPVENLSGGWRMRLEFAKMLLNRPNFLILDEPTNHLDLPSIEWFETYLKKFDGTILFVSHDKDLLNRLATHVIHLRDGQINLYKGNFDAFLDAFAIKQEQNLHIAKKLQQQYEHIEKFVDRFRASATKAKQVQSRLKNLTKLKMLEDTLHFEDLDGNMCLNLNTPIPSGKTVLKAEKIIIGYDKPLIKELSFNILKGQRIAILGANGLGKTTLLKTLLGKLPLLSGNITAGHNVIPGYFSQDHEEGLEEHLTVLQNVTAANSTIREQEARALLGSLGLAGEEVFKHVKVLSGGEKNRVALACMLARKPNVLFLDEPTNHLDLYACENLGNALNEYEGTVIFVSHNRNFIQTVATHTLYLKERGTVNLEKFESFI
jgi:ATP-binding cassette, subfamily F, member 3